MKILVTGGTGFIGSHTCVELLDAGYEVVIIDNLYNSKREVVQRIEQISGHHVAFYEEDCLDEQALEQIFTEHKIDAVIHFAGYKAVGESVAKPLMYYENNLMSTLNLCKVMRRHGCQRLVFSSSATVYGDPERIPIDEECRLGPTTNPYGTTKLMIEQILRDLHVSDAQWNIALLRYFNPIGAHKSGLLGESPNDIPNNLMPYIVKVAAKELPLLHVFGNDYDTPATWWIWPRAMSMPWTSCFVSTSASMRTTWAPAMATACWKSCMPLPASMRWKCHIRSRRVVPAISPPAMPAPIKHIVNWAGKQKWGLRKCVGMPGILPARPQQNDRLARCGSVK